MEYDRCSTLLNTLLYLSIPSYRTLLSSLGEFCESVWVQRHKKAGRVPSKSFLCGGASGKSGDLVYLTHASRGGSKEALNNKSFFTTLENEANVCFLPVFLSLPLTASR